MRELSPLRLILAMAAVSVALRPGMLPAVELGWGNLGGLLVKSPVDVPLPQASDQCRHEHCVGRVPVQDCVKGKKVVFDILPRCEYVTIPETRYRWKMKCIKKEIPCPYCMPTCETQEVDRCYESERWDTYDAGCGKLHCKSCERKLEKVPCKQCGRKPGETVVKVHYWTCVKEPYIVYRQVKRPVCVKKPRYEHVTVPITRYVCTNCNDPGCSDCSNGAGCEHCGDGGCGQCCEYGEAAPLEETAEQNGPGSLTMPIGGYLGQLITER